MKEKAILRVSPPMAHTEEAGGSPAAACGVLLGCSEIISNTWAEKGTKAVQRRKTGTNSTFFPLICLLVPGGTHMCKRMAYNFCWENSAIINHSRPDTKVKSIHDLSIWQRGLFQKQLTLSRTPSWPKNLHSPGHTKIALNLILPLIMGKLSLHGFCHSQLPLNPDRRGSQKPINEQKFESKHQQLGWDQQAHSWGFYYY